MTKNKKIKLNFHRRIMIVFDFVGIIILWRGVWGLMDLFLFPDSQISSYIASLILGVVLVFIDGNGIKDISR